MCMGVFPICISMHHVHASCSMRPEEGVRSPGTWITDSCEVPGRWWELNLGFLQKRPCSLLLGYLSRSPTPINTFYTASPKPDECTKAFQTELLYLAKMSWFLLFFYFFASLTTTPTLPKLKESWVCIPLWPPFPVYPVNMVNKSMLNAKWAKTLWNITCAQLPNSTSVLQ